MSLFSELVSALEMIGSTCRAHPARLAVADVVLEDSK
jgi:hypothetical protein